MDVSVPSYPIEFLAEIGVLFVASLIDSVRDDLVDDKIFRSVFVAFSSSFG